ncbi:MAG: radical SAM protein [Candidatus Woesearchaeota archaeon]|jgi:hypothetical protein
MATLTFETLQFREQTEGVKIIFHGSFYCLIPHEALSKLGKYVLKDKSIEFPNAHEKKVQHTFSMLLETGFQNLYSVFTGKKTIYVHKNSGIPLLGTRFIGIQDRGTTFLELKPLTGCTMGCIFCSVDEGIGSKKTTDFFVEREYLVEETQKLLDFKKCHDIHIYINLHGEPLLYPELTTLITDLKAIQWVKKVTLITTAALLTKEKINEFVIAGLDELNISLSAMDDTLAKKIMGNPAYSISHVTEMIHAAHKKIKVTIAPVWVDGINDAEMEKIIAFAQKNNCIVRIQKFCYNKGGRNPIEEITWDEFFSKIEQLEKKTGMKLKEDIEAYPLKKTVEYPVPFKRKEVVEATIISAGRYCHERLGVSRNRLISIPSCKKESGKIKIRITHSTHNVIIGEIL